MSFQQVSTSRTQMTDIGWGKLQAYEAYGRAGDKKEDFDIVSYEEALSDKYASFRHASHSMLFARNDAILWELYNCRGAVLVILFLAFHHIMSLKEQHFSYTIISLKADKLCCVPARNISTRLTNELGATLNREGRRTSISEYTDTSCNTLCFNLKQTWSKE